MKLIDIIFKRYEDKDFLNYRNTKEFVLFRFEKIKSMEYFSLPHLDKAVSDYIKSLSNGWIGITSQRGSYLITDITLSDEHCSVEVRFQGLCLYGGLNAHQRTEDGSWCWTAINADSYLP